MTNSTPKLSVIFHKISLFHKEHREHIKVVSKERYLMMADEISEIENMKKLSADEIMSAPSSELLKFNLNYMNLMDFFSHMAIKED